MFTAAPGPREIAIDVQCELLALGVEHLIAEVFAVPVVKLAQRMGEGGGVLLADFNGERDQTEARISSLLARGRVFSLLVIMLVRWDDLAIRLMRGGARGVLYPSASRDEVIEAIRTVSVRQTYFPPVLQRTLAQRYVGAPEVDAQVERLTPRELEFVRALSRGMSTSEVARELGISIKTADTHRANLLRKLGARNNVEVTRLALRHGFVPL